MRQQYIEASLYAAIRLSILFAAREARRRSDGGAAHDRVVLCFDAQNIR